MNLSLTVIGLVVWLAGFHPKFGAWLETNTVVTNRWPWIPLGLVAVHLFATAIHDSAKTWEQSIIQRTETGSLPAERFRAQREDLVHLREALNKSVERGQAIYDASAFDIDKAQHWTRGVQTLLDGNLKPDIAGEFPDQYVTGNNMLNNSLAALQNIASSIRVDDLSR